ncbi:MAG: zinc ribbon domain-containing protein [Euryarchaeota archaeon]|nr:zinc ribbon domain-containing protein [Euryarchaeota archaeon]
MSLRISIERLSIIIMSAIFLVGFSGIYIWNVMMMGVPIMEYGGIIDFHYTEPWKLTVLLMIILSSLITLILSATWPLLMDRPEDGVARLQCPRCGAPVGKDYMACPSCTLPLKQICSSCGERMPASYNACPRCGKTLRDPGSDLP